MGRPFLDIDLWIDFECIWVDLFDHFAQGLMFFASCELCALEHRFCIVFGTILDDFLDRPFSDNLVSTKDALQQTRIRRF